MSTRQSPTCGRRRWLIAFARYLLAGGLLALALHLLRRSFRGGCRQPAAFCGGCDRLARCGLPQARRWRA